MAIRVQPLFSARAGKITVFGAMLAGALLAVLAIPFLPARAAQAQAARNLREHRALEAFKVADAQLQRKADEPHLRELALAAATQHVDTLVRTGKPDEALAWGRLQLPTRPYLSPLAERLNTLSGDGFVNALANARAGLKLDDALQAVASVSDTLQAVQAVRALSVALALPSLTPAMRTQLQTSRSALLIRFPSADVKSTVSGDSVGTAP